MALCAAAPALGDPPDDDRIAFVPRTSEEQTRIARVTAPTTDFTKPEDFETHPAGAATVRARTDRLALDQPPANMSLSRKVDFTAGKSMFDKLWVQAPTVTRASDGLGPLYNARGCQNCHLNAGRGHLPDGPDDNAISFVLALAVPGETDPDLADIADYIATAPEPTYGRQVQEFATSGLPAEAALDFAWETRDVTLAGGETITLRRPGASGPDTTGRCCRGRPHRHGAVTRRGGG